MKLRCLCGAEPMPGQDVPRHWLEAHEDLHPFFDAGHGMTRVIPGRVVWVWWAGEITEKEASQ